MSRSKRPRSGSDSHAALDFVTTQQTTPSDQNDPAKRTFYSQSSSNNTIVGPAYRLYPATLQHGHPDGHHFKPTTIAGHAQVQMGDSYHNYTAGGQVTGPLSVAGNMIVNNSTGYEQYLRQRMSQSDSDIALKQALYYEGMERRKAQLDDVDPATFDWIWTQTSFATWLESGDGLYWICGKPASGKSTLMNHLLRAESARVKSYLAVNGKDPLLLHFFFDFRAGSGIANTIIGLLRSFLLQLIQNSSAIEHYVLDRCSYRLDGEWPKIDTELLDLVCESLQHEPRTICGFIDGLDEYIGNLIKLADIIILLQRRSGMKLCLASRPYPELKHKLGLTSFEMQSHNNATIRAYADTAFTSLEAYLNQKDLQDVAAQIEDDANGVILWARFAVDEVVCAVLRGEGLREIWQLLDEFPLEMAQVYERILGRLSHSQWRQAAVAFFIIEHWETSFCGLGGLLELPSEPMMLLYSRILFELHDAEYSDFSSDQDEPRFCLKLRSMLQGLIIFTDYRQRNFRNPALMHKTLGAFLDSSEEYTLMKQLISQVVDSETLAPVFLCQNTMTADRLCEPITNIYNATNPRPVITSQLRRHMLRYDQFSRATIKYLRHASAFRAWSHPKIAPWYFSAGETSIAREQEHSSDRATWCEPQSRIDETVFDDIYAEYPELVHTMLGRYRPSLEQSLPRDSAALRAEDRELLMVQCLEALNTSVKRYEKRLKEFSSSELQYEECSQSDDDENISDDPAEETNNSSDADVAPPPQDTSMDLPLSIPKSRRPWLL